MRGALVIALALVGCQFRGGAANGSDGAPPPRDAARDAPPDVPRDATTTSCTPIAGGSGAITVPRLTSAPAIDASDFGDWVACFIDLSSANAALVRNEVGMPASYPSGRFSLEYVGTTLYVAAEVVGVPPLGSAAPPVIYENASVELYIDGDGLATAQSYDAHTQQIDVDHNGALQAYSNSSADTLTGVTSSVVTEADDVTFRMVVAVPASALGLAQFASPFGFDVDWSEGNGTSQLAEVYWAQTCSTCTCGGAYCDARELGSATIAP
ncbi:MAG TPA: sugar-binding protein [Kofleriaceae bacterium]|nr:sugar-binding protein [Kofleriaceae bacterium]